MPVILTICTDKGLQRQVQKLTRQELAKEKKYIQQFKQKHSKLVYGYKITNTMAVFDLVVQWYIEIRVLIGIE